MVEEDFSRIDAMIDSGQLDGLYFYQARQEERTDRSEETSLARQIQAMHLAKSQLADEPSRSDREELKQIIESGEAARGRLIAANTHIAGIVAAQFKYGPIEFSDLLQTANIGLIQAADNFNPDGQGGFHQYAKSVIKNEIIDTLRARRANPHIPISTWKVYQEVRKIEELLTQSLGRTPTEVEIANEMEGNISQKEVLFLRNLQTEPLGLNETRKVVEKETYLDAMRDNSQNTEEEAAANMLKERLTAALNSLEEQGDLKPKHIALLNLSFGLCMENGQYQEQLSPKEISEKLGMSTESVYKTLPRLLKRLSVLPEMQYFREFVE